jgi:hypothetical protein
MTHDYNKLFPMHPKLVKFGERLEDLDKHIARYAKGSGGKVTLHSAIRRGDAGRVERDRAASRCSRCPPRNLHARPWARCDAAAKRRRTARDPGQQTIRGVLSRLSLQRT